MRSARVGCASNSPLRSSRISLVGDAQSLSDYKIVLYTQDGGQGWVAEVPAVPGCYALMQSRDEALRELERVFEMIREEYAETGKRLPADSTELLTRA